MRLRPILLSCSLAVLGASLPSLAQAELPELIVPGKGHRYVVWLDPNLEDGSTPPLTATEQLSYCSAAEGMARRIWRVTNGRHRIFQVEFVYGDPPMHRDIEWHRYHSTPNANLHGGRVAMYDRTTLANHRFVVDAAGDVVLEAFCENGLILQDTGQLNREICVDESGNSPLLSPVDNGVTLAHELGHYTYGVRDEYVTNPPADLQLLYGFPYCDVEDWGTSIMSRGSRDHWCDVHSHITGRNVMEPFVDDVHIETNSTQADSWTQAQNYWADLMSYNPGVAFVHETGSVPNNEYFTAPVADWEPLAGDEFCVFTGSMIDGAIVNDLVVMIDKSGSMNYRYSAEDVTAYEAAFGAGIAHYNRTPSSRLAGVSVFDSSVQRLIPYQTRNGSTLHIGDYDLTAGGTTNLCQAIDDAAAQIRGSGSDDTFGETVLLTDGRPTVAGCNSSQDVLDAAMRACQPADGSDPVLVSTVAFGDADFALIQQVADICGGVARMVDGSGDGAPNPAPPQFTGIALSGVGTPIAPSSQPTPLSIKVATSRLAYHERNFKEAMFVQRPYPPFSEGPYEKSFEVPPGTQELEAVWMGEYATFQDPDVSGIRCRFDHEYNFELLDPAGNSTGFSPLHHSIETAYRTRTKRVQNPTPGTWTMRTTGGAPCQPEVAMFAEIRNDIVGAHVTMESKKFKMNDRIPVKAILETGPDTALTGISVNARVVNGNTGFDVPMYDDGVSGDDLVAGDGEYSGVINPGCAFNRFTPGAYRLVVELTSDKNVAQPVLFPNPDVYLEGNPNALSPAKTISLTEEELFVVEGCNNPTPACGYTTNVDACAPTDVVLTSDVSIPPGGTNEVTVDITNCPVGTSGVTVGLGPGITTGNVRSTYNDTTRSGTVTFDVTVAEDAPTGEVPVRIFYGRQRCDSSGTILDICQEPPTELPTAVHATCGGAGLENVQLAPPDVSDSCIEGAMVTGVVVRENDALLSPPRAVSADGIVELPLGSHVIEWTISNGTTSHSVQQTIEVLPSLAAAGKLDLRDRASVVDAENNAVAVGNFGKTLTEVGVEARVGDLISSADVFLRDRSRVDGSIHTAGQVTAQNNVSVDGSINESVNLPDVRFANPEATFPQDMGPGLILEPDQTASLPPGTHGAIHVRSRSTLQLAAGDYYLASLSLEPQATLLVEPSVQLFVRDSLMMRGSIVNQGGELAPVLLAYYGEQEVTFESEFVGRLIADSARVNLGSGQELDFVGQFYAKDLEVRPGVTVSCGIPSSSIAGGATPTLVNPQGEPPGSICSVSIPGRDRDSWLKWLALVLIALPLARRFRKEMS